MGRTRVRWVVVIVALVAGAVIGPSVRADQIPPIMPVSEVRPGMTGYGLTALQGAEPEQFPVEVLAVIDGWYPKGHIILIRLGGPVIDEAGAVSGMSGSPIYIEDRLVGALAYGWRFTKVPLAGVTPAEEILQAQEIDLQGGEPAPGAARRESARRMRRRTAELAEKLLARPAEDLPAPLLEDALMRAALPPLLPQQRARSLALPGPSPADDRAQFGPLPLPLALGGLGPRAEPLLDALGAAGFMPVQAAGGPAHAEDDLEPRPGMPGGVVFVSGDLNVSGMGTITWVDGERVAAFGHPMMGLGAVDLPFAVGRAQAVVPSLQMSFRVSSADRIVGRLTQDRDSSIIARLGERAPMLPCTVRVGGLQEDEYNYEVAGFWQTAPFYTFLAVAYSSLRFQSQDAPYTMRARSRIRIEGREEPLILENDFADWSPLRPAFTLVQMPLAALAMNPFREVAIESVDYEIELKEGFEVALIESVRAERLQVPAGGQVTLHVRLREWQGREVVREVPLEIPETARPGSEVRVLVCDAMTSMMLRSSMDPGLFAPRSFEHLIEMLEYTEPSRDLHVRVSVVEEGVRYRGRPMPALPSSAMNILQFGASGRTDRLTSDRVTSVQTPYILEGAHMLTLTVEEPEPFAP